ncbi:hypothetical protein [Carbonactinospora thermoautotrophica]|nr:hypothetical protein [Carbonactinospora thermoautotrophica]
MRTRRIITVAGIVLAAALGAGCGDVSYDERMAYLRKTAQRGSRRTGS